MYPDDGSSNDGNQGPLAGPPKWNSVSSDDVFWPEERDDSVLEPQTGRVEDWGDVPTWEEYLGPIDPPVWGSTGWEGSASADENRSPSLKQPEWSSVGWDEVSQGRPKVVLPKFGPTISDAIAATEEMNRLRDVSPEFDLLVDEALLDLLIRQAPGNG